MKKKLFRLPPGIAALCRKINRDMRERWRREKIDARAHQTALRDLFEPL